jgi:predicted PurR-regulated permease PerM
MEKNLGPRVFLVSLLFSAALLLSLFWAYLSAIVLGLLIASAFYPIFLRTKKLLKGRESLASFITCLLIVVVLAMPVSWFVGTLSKQAFDFYSRATSNMSITKAQAFLQSDSEWVQRIKGWSRAVGLELTPERIEDLSAAIGKNVGLFLYRQITTAASNVLSFLIHFFLMMVVIYFLFRDGTELKEFLIQLIPVPKTQLEKVAGKFDEMVRAIVVGNGLSGVVQGVFGGFGFYMFGIQSPLLWGTVIAFMAFLPIIGASIVFIPTTVILLLNGETAKAMGYLLYNIFYSCLIEYVAKPRLIGRGMKMSAILVFIGILGGLKLFGILGIVYGPLIITVFLTLAEIYRLEYK